MLKLYENIKNRRTELRITQDELAHKLGYSGKSMIAKIEKGLVDIPQSKIEEFASALSVTPAYLMGWTDEKPSDTLSDLTPPERDHMRKYRAVDDDGRQLVDNMLDTMLVQKEKTDVLASAS